MDLVFFSKILIVGHHLLDKKFFGGVVKRSKNQALKRRFKPISPTAAAAAGGLMFCLCFLFISLFLTISLRSIMLRSTGPIFAKFSRLVDLCDERSGVSFSLSRGMLPWQPIL